MTTQAPAQPIGKLSISGRLSFPALFEAEEYEGKQQYKASFIIEPGSESDKKLRAKMEAVAKEKWDAKGPAILKAALAKNSNKEICYYSGDTKTYDGYAGNMILATVRDVAKKRPLVIDRDRSPLTAEDGKPYAGCYVNATVELWAQDNKHGKTIRCTLLGVQFVKDGDAFSASSVASEDDFDDLGMDDENESLA